MLHLQKEDGDAVDDDAGAITELPGVNYFVYDSGNVRELPGVNYCLFMILALYVNYLV